MAHKMYVPLVNYPVRTCIGAMTPVKYIIQISDLFLTGSKIPIVDIFDSYDFTNIIQNPKWHMQISFCNELFLNVISPSPFCK